MSWYFNAGDAPYLSCGDLTDLDGETELSIHSWVKLDSAASERHAVAKWDGTDGVRLYYDSSGLNTKVHIPVMRTRVGGSTCRAEGDTDNLMAEDIWYSMGGSWKVNTGTDGIRVYLDGVRRGEASTTSQGASTFPNLTAPLYIGRQGTSSASWYGWLGETAIWNEQLDDVEFLALSQGVPAVCIRPWALIVLAHLRRRSSPDYFRRPQADAVADLTHYNVSTTADDDYPYAEPWQVKGEDAEFSPTTGTSWSSWEKVAEPAGSYFLRTGLTNGKQYRYKLRAVDTSGNPSTDSTVETVTPAAGVQGPPLVIPYPAHRLYVPAIKRKRDEEQFR